MHNETTRLSNADAAVVKDFGEEWSRFDQSAMSDVERQQRFDEYFAAFPWAALPPEPVGFDAGCGTGRWAVLAAPRVAHLYCIDPSSAIEVAKRNLAAHPNCSFLNTTIDDMPLADDSMDFGYSLGVLHHLPDTEAGLATCVRKLKRGAPFLVYLYYAFDNKPVWFRTIWQTSDMIRRVVATWPSGVKHVVSSVLAVAVYFPLARMSKLLETLGVDVQNVPLSYYRHRSFYSMRTDALDRFGTRLEKRFTRAQIQSMLERAGLTDIRFNAHMPFWCASGRKK